MPKIVASVDSALPRIQAGLQWLVENSEVVVGAIGAITTAWLVATVAAHPYATAILAIVSALAAMSAGGDGDKLLSEHTQEELQVLQDWIDVRNELNGMADWDQLNINQITERQALEQRERDLWAAVPTDLYQQYEDFYGGPNNVMERGEYLPVPVELAHGNPAEYQQTVNAATAQFAASAAASPFNMENIMSNEHIVSLLSALNITMQQVATNTGQGTTVVLDTGALVGGIRNRMDISLGSLSATRERQ